MGLAVNVSLTIQPYGKQRWVLFCQSLNHDSAAALISFSMNRGASAFEEGAFLELNPFPWRITKDHIETTGPSNARGRDIAYHLAG